MNDEDLREKFAAWARPLHEAVPPPAGSSAAGQEARRTAGRRRGFRPGGRRGSRRRGRRRPAGPRVAGTVGPILRRGIPSGPVRHLAV